MSLIKIVDKIQRHNGTQNTCHAAKNNISFSSRGNEFKKCEQEHFLKLITKFVQKQHTI